MLRRPLVATTLAAVTTAVFAVGGCSGSTPAPTPADAKRVLADAKKAADAAGTVAFTLASTDVPTKADGVTAANGNGVVSASEPKFSGTITGQVKGVAGTMGLIAIGPKAWIKLFTPDYRSVDLDSLGAPNPSEFFDPMTGLSSLLTATQDPVAGPRERVGSEIVRTYSGTLPGARIKELMHLGDGAAPVQVSWGITEGGELRSARLTGVFYGTTTSIYTLTLRDYGRPVAITAP